MRKRTVRNGLRLVLAALVMIIVVSFYHELVASFFALGSGGGSRVFHVGIFWASALGGYGVVLAGFGLVSSARFHDAGVRLAPLTLLIVGAICLFFYLMTQSLFSFPNDSTDNTSRSITIYYCDNMMF